MASKKITELQKQLEELARDYDDLEAQKILLEEKNDSIKTELSRLREQLERLERELADQKSASDKTINRLTKSLKEMEKNLERQMAENEKLRQTLEGVIAEAKAEIEKLMEKIQELSSPPHSYCHFIRVNEDKTIDVRFDGRRLAVHYDPDLDVSKLKNGQILRLGPAMTVLKADDFDPEGDAATVRELLDSNRVIVSHRFEEEKIVQLVEELCGKVKIGDRLLLDARGQLAMEKLPKLEVREFEIEEVPNVTFDDIGGLDEQIKIIKENIIWPFLHQELFAKHLLKPIKGALFFGPPGNGKTMLGKALANYIAHEVQRIYKLDKPQSFFMYIPGPAFLRGIVGQTEALIRDVFNTAKTKGKEGNIPVIIFIDEMEAIAPVRGSGISSDIENTNVPMLTSMIDGLEELNNVIVIGASNRQDRIDSAILREGRLDLKIRINRPNEAAARQIFLKHLTAKVPIHPKYLESDEYIPTDSQTGKPRLDRDGNIKKYHFGKDPQKVVEYFIEKAISRIFETKFDVEYSNKTRQILNLKDYISGAMIKNIVDRAKRLSIKNHLEKGEPIGIRTSYIFLAIEAAAQENEELVKHGGEITSIRSSISSNKKEIEDLERSDIL